MTDSDFDDLLNGTLKKDALVEPLAGLDERVIKRVMASRSPRKWSLIRWSVLATCFVCLLVYIGIVHEGNSFHPPDDSSRFPTRGNKHATSARVASEKESPLQAARSLRSKAIVGHQSKPQPSEHDAERAEALPKLDVFPTPSQPSEPVRELVSLSLRTNVKVSGLGPPPQQAQTSEYVTVEPIKIAAIEVPPLVPLADAGKESDHKSQGANK